MSLGDIMVVLYIPKYFLGKKITLFNIVSLLQVFHKTILDTVISHSASGSDSRYLLCSSISDNN